MVLKVADKQESDKTDRHITFARPNKVVLDAGTVRLISDGKEATGILVKQKKYTVAPAPEAINERTITQLPLPGATSAVMFGGADSLPITMLLSLLSGDDPTKPLLEGAEALKFEPDRVVGDKKLKVLLIDRPRSPDLRLVVDPTTKLLQSIELAFDLKEINATLPKEQQVKELSVAWSAGSIKTEVPKDAFAFKAPDDYSKVEAGAAGDERNPVEDLVGKPAPDFSLSVLDAGGKTRTVTKADLAGKVVMIDFWATWCGPCLKELPEVQKMVESFAKDKKNVVVVALSEDTDPADPAELRKKVEKTLEDKKLTLIGSPVSVVALDLEGTIGTAFKVEALPTVVIIDAKGIVQAAHVGYEENVRDVLTQEIEALLAGKSIAKPVEASDKP